MVETKALSGAKYGEVTAWTSQNQTHSQRVLFFKKTPDAWWLYDEADTTQLDSLVLQMNVVDVIVDGSTKENTRVFFSTEKKNTKRKKSLGSSMFPFLGTRTEAQREPEG